MAWFELKGDSRLGRCATENCGGQPVMRLEVGGIGSDYCSGCHAIILAMIDATEAKRASPQSIEEPNKGDTDSQHGEEEA